MAEMLTVWTPKKEIFKVIAMLHILYSYVVYKKKKLK